MAFIFPLLIGLVAGVVLTALYGKKAEAFVATEEAKLKNLSDAEKKEFQDLEAKYGAKLKSIEASVLSRYNELKAKL